MEKNTTKNTEFNPIKEDKDGIRAKRMIWSTSTLDKAIKGLTEGRKLIANPFYENNIKILKGDLVFEHTKAEVEEYKRCMNDIIYFTNKYCKLMTPEGIRNIKLRDYQEAYLKQVEANQMNIMLSARQAGKTTTSAIFMLHYILFNTDKTSLILGNKRATACDILSKLKSIFYELPYFLKPGILKWNEGEIALDNGCRVKAEATTDKSGIGMTIHCCLMDEFAHVPKNILDTFYNNLLPVVTAAKGKVIITSTQNGYNLFYRLWCAAKSGDSDYTPFEVTWDMIPEWNPDKHCWEKRDEEWHRRMVANYGSEEAFNAQFGTNFDVNSNSLIDNRILKKFEAEAIEFKPREMPGIPNASSFYWNPNYELSDMQNDYFVITIDISEGIGGDYTVFTFNKLIQHDEEVNTITIGFFKNNYLSVEKCTNTLNIFCSTYMNINKYLISLEYNLYGELFAKYILDFIETHPENVSRFNEDVIMKYWNDDMTRYTLGKKITSKTKLVGVSLFKDYFEHSKIINRSSQFLNEVTNFCEKSNGTFSASFGHDDLVMSQLQMAYVMENPQYKYLCQDLLTEKELNHVSTSFNPYSSDPYSDPYYNNSGNMYMEYNPVQEDKLNNINRLR